MRGSGLHLQMPDVLRVGFFTLGEIAHDGPDRVALADAMSDSARRTRTWIDDEREAVILVRNDL